jgi:tetratricopeptide (TPR) repeat protein
MRLSSVHYFYNWKRGRPLEEAREYAERALSLDPEDAQPYWRLYHISSFESKHEEAEHHIRRWFSEDSVPPSFRAARVVAGNDSLAEEQITQELRNASHGAISIAAADVAQWTDDLAEARRLARLLTDPQQHPPKVRGSGHVILAHLAAQGGQWSTAKEELAAAKPLYSAPSIVFEAMLAAAPFWQVPDEDLKAIREQLNVWDGSDAVPGRELDRNLVFPTGMYPLLRIYLLGLLCARLGDNAQATDYAAQLEGLEGPLQARSLSQDLSRGVRAQVAINQGRLEDALVLLEQAQMDALGGQFLYTLATSFLMQNHERFLRAELLSQLGREEKALGWYGSFQLGLYNTAIYRAPTHLRRGEIYEQLGDSERALEHYAHFVELWKDADPEFQPLVEEVRQRMVRMVREW